MKKIIIDTDIGDDVDDALALAFAIKSNEFDILGISTVFKNIKSRADLAYELLCLLDKSEIPIFEGIGNPIVCNVNPKEIPCQCKILAESSRPRNNLHAVDFIIDSVKNNSDLTIAAIGPLTNIAVAILKAPEIMCNAKIVMMGGVLSAHEPEWNIICDPEAANIVMQSGADLKFIGLDVTIPCGLSEEVITKIQNSKKADVKFLGKLIEAWKKESGFGVTLHDPLVFEYLIDESIISFEKKFIQIELNGKITRGATVDYSRVFNRRVAESNCEFAVKANYEKILEMFTDLIFI